MRYLPSVLLAAVAFFFFPSSVISGVTPGPGHPGAAVNLLASNARNGCAVTHPSDSSVEWDCVRLKKGESLESLFGEDWRDVARFNRIDRRRVGPYAFIKVPKRLTDIKDFSPMPRSYPGAADIPKFILIDLSEQFLGAYEYGRLVFSSPVTTGEAGRETPKGWFRISAFSRRHSSSRYTIENTEIPYPMNYALRFHVTRAGISYWVHGRDLPGYPASHGCIGLYDELMQKRYYNDPGDPVLDDARRLYEWAVGDSPDNGAGPESLADGPVTLITGNIPEAAGTLAAKNRPFQGLSP